jgi:hypothetical protein
MGRDVSADIVDEVDEIDDSHFNEDKDGVEVKFPQYDSVHLQKSQIALETAFSNLHALSAFVVKGDDC